MDLRIRDLREDSDIRQKEIAAYLLCDQSLYSKYERGERPLSLDYAVKLAEYYNVSVDYLVGLTDERRPYPRAKRRK
ncbi:MAG: helix-turn-helix transcriptional regulator [Oscillospiraceae bacterium]|nr:helix-turn-helix transcriptional regulator [Oscillospiraceae bacterium]